MPPDIPGWVKNDIVPAFEHPTGLALPGRTRETEHKRYPGDTRKMSICEVRSAIDIGHSRDDLKKTCENRKRAVGYRDRKFLRRRPFAQVFLSPAHTRPARQAWRRPPRRASVTRLNLFPTICCRSCSAARSRSGVTARRVFQAHAHAHARNRFRSFSRAPLRPRRSAWSPWVPGSLDDGDDGGACLSAICLTNR